MVKFPLPIQSPNSSINPNQQTESYHYLLTKHNYWPEPPLRLKILVHPPLEPLLPLAWPLPLSGAGGGPEGCDCDGVGGKLQGVVIIWGLGDWGWGLWFSGVTGCRQIGHVYIIKLGGFSIYQSDFPLAKDNLRHGLLAISSRIRNDTYACMANWRPPRQQPNPLCKLRSLPRLWPLLDRLWFSAMIQSLLSMLVAAHFPGAVPWVLRWLGRVQLDCTHSHPLRLAFQGHERRYRWYHRWRY